jgi:hypothetical protein
MKTQPDDVFRLQGIGPKAMTQIMSFMDTVYVAPVGQKRKWKKKLKSSSSCLKWLKRLLRLATDEPIAIEDVVDIETVQAAKKH